MKHLVVIVTLFLIGWVEVKAQAVFGVVVDSETKEPLVGSVVTIPGTQFKVLTDDDGRFKIDTDAAHNIIRFECLGYDRVC